MGVDCKITLPDAVRIRDVANVIGILLGKEARLDPLDHNNAVALRVDGVSVSNSTAVEGCAEINIKDAPWGHDGKPGDRWFFYHFEWSGGAADGYDTKLGRGLMPRCTAINIAMARELVTFFGGEVDYNDCDDSEVDFTAPEQPDLRANDGEAWDKFQRRMFAVKSLTKQQVAAMKKHDAYARRAA